MSTLHLLARHLKLCLSRQRPCTVSFFVVHCRIFHWWNLYCNLMLVNMPLFCLKTMFEVFLVCPVVPSSVPKVVKHLNQPDFSQDRTLEQIMQFQACLCCVLKFSLQFLTPSETLKEAEYPLNVAVGLRETTNVSPKYDRIDHHRLNLVIVLSRNC